MSLPCRKRCGSEAGRRPPRLLPQLWPPGLRSRAVSVAARISDGAHLLAWPRPLAAGAEASFVAGNRRARHLACVSPRPVPRLRLLQRPRLPLSTFLACRRWPRSLHHCPGSPRAAAASSLSPTPPPRPPCPTRSWPPCPRRARLPSGPVGAHSGRPDHSCAGRDRCVLWRKVSAPMSRRGTTSTSSTLCAVDPLQPWLTVVGHERGPCHFTAVIGRQASSTTLSLAAVPESTLGKIQNHTGAVSPMPV